MFQSFASPFVCLSLGDTGGMGQLQQRVEEIFRETTFPRYLGINKMMERGSFQIAWFGFN